MEAVKIVATIEARMTSSRLPGKVLLPAANRPMLEHLVNRLKKVTFLDAIVLATTINESDDVLAEFAKENQIFVYRGSEEDVMARVIGAAKSVSADVIVEITGDCPIIDPEVIEQTIQLFRYNECEYASNVQVRSYPIGMDTQVYRLATLERSYAMTQEALDREHVTRHIRLHPELFKQIHLVAPARLWWPELGLTLDEQGDYELLRDIIEYFSDKLDFSCGDVLELLKTVHPEWLILNQHVKRKGLNA